MRRARDKRRGGKRGSSKDEKNEGEERQSTNTRAALREEGRGAEKVGVHGSRRLPLKPWTAGQWGGGWRPFQSGGIGIQRAGPCRHTQGARRKAQAAIFFPPNHPAEE